MNDNNPAQVLRFLIENLLSEQLVLANYFGVSRGTLHYWLMGKVAIKPKHQEKIIKLYLRAQELAAQKRINFKVALSELLIRPEFFSGIEEKFQGINQFAFKSHGATVRPLIKEGPLTEDPKLKKARQLRDIIIQMITQRCNEKKLLFHRDEGLHHVDIRLHVDFTIFDYDGKHLRELVDVRDRPMQQNYLFKYVLIAEQLYKATKQEKLLIKIFAPKFFGSTKAVADYINRYCPLEFELIEFDKIINQEFF